MRALGCGLRVYCGSYTHSASICTHTKCRYLPCVLMSELLSSTICNGFQLHDTKRLSFSSLFFYVYTQPYTNMNDRLYIVGHV